MVAKREGGGPDRVGLGGRDRSVGCRTMWEKMAKIRTPRSANPLRAVVWEPKEEGAE